MWKDYQVKKDKPKICDSSLLLWHLNQDTEKWQSISRHMYWYYKLTGKKEVRINKY